MKYRLKTGKIQFDIPEIKIDSLIIKYPKKIKIDLINY